MQAEPNRSGYTFWPLLIDWAAWWLGHILGGFCTREARFDALRVILAARTADRAGRGSEPLVAAFPGDAGHNIGICVMRRLDDRQYLAPAWEALRREMTELALLRERYPDLVSTDDEPLRSLVEFDFVHNAALAVKDDHAVQHWTMYHQQAESFAYRLHADARLRERVASAVGLDLPAFDEKVPEALMQAHALGRFPDRDAVHVLQHGSRR